jgi:hypothetical protein
MRLLDRDAWDARLSLEPAMSGTDFVYPAVLSNLGLILRSPSLSQPLFSFTALANPSVLLVAHGSTTRIFFTTYAFTRGRASKAIL